MDGIDGQDGPAPFLEGLRAIVGSGGLVTDAHDLAPFQSNRRGPERGEAFAAVLPRTTTEVAQVMGLCASTGVTVTPQGGITGLCAGSVPAAGSIAVSLKRMNRVRALDLYGNSITVEAGCILADLQQIAADNGRLFPLSLAAEGSCQIGGNLATNAGGVHVLKYGVMRDLALGLEVVLADGRIIHGLNPLRKDNRGYDLKHLFIGSEGTLGIITAATLKLFPRPRERAVALLALGGLENALDVFVTVRSVAGDTLSAFELVDGAGLDCVLRHIPGAVSPFAERADWMVLVELVGDQVEPLMNAALETAFVDGDIVDGVIASSESQAQKLWRLREEISEAMRLNGAVIGHDVSVPIARIPQFIRDARAALLEALPGLAVVAFGHLGDGNIHLNLGQPAGVDEGRFRLQANSLSQTIYDLTAALGGSFSAEHGVGLSKVAELERYRDPADLALMRALKGVLDPSNLLNPGKVLALR